MNNDFLKAMNHDTKVFFTLALDLIEWVHSNGKIFSLNQDELTSADEFSYGFLLAGIIYNEEIRNIFSRYNVTFKNCFSSLPDKFTIENSEPSLEETFIYNAYDFNGLKDDFIKNKTDTFVSVVQSNGDPYGVRTHKCMRERHVC